MGRAYVLPKEKCVSPGRPWTNVEQLGGHFHPQQFDERSSQLATDSGLGADLLELHGSRQCREHIDLEGGDNVNEGVVCFQELSWAIIAHYLMTEIVIDNRTIANSSM